MIRFYCPDLEPGMNRARLPESDSQHCVRVLRMSEGEELEASDGRGHIYSCRLAVAHPKRAEIEITGGREQPKVWGPRITVAVAPTKHLDRMEWLVEKLVEIGVDRIVAVRCRRSERKELKTERLEKIAISAMKQSLKAVLPEVSGPVPLDDFLRGCRTESGQKFIGYCDSASDRVLLAKAYEPGSDVTILVGPEGDFTPEEVEAACASGFRAVTMGDNRLRTETAALVGADTVHIINQRML